jgi:FlaA1/EpsC-like NDP-sugar epimerase
MMDKRQRLLLVLEMLWWVVTAIVVLAVLYPIQKAMHVWPFQTWNIVFVITLVTLTRYIFLLPHTFLAKRQEIKVGLIIAVFPFLFYLIGGLSGFMTYVEEHTFEQLTGHLPAADKKSIENYLWNEMLFFGAGSIIAAPVLAGRLFLSIWRLRNRGTV